MTYCFAESLQFILHKEVKFEIIWNNIKISRLKYETTQSLFF